MGEISISVQWRTAVGLGDGSVAYLFPAKLTEQFRKLYAVPAVYRWRVMRDSVRWPNEQREKIYIGEGEELTRRMQWVLTPFSAAKAGDTSKRLKEIFTKLVSEGRRVVIDIADVEAFEINGISFDKRDLGDRFKRKMIEAFLLVEAQASSAFELLNISIDPLDQDREALNRLTPRQIRETVNRYGLRKAP